jgi:DNA ligase-1
LEPLYSNQNAPERNALGYQERSTHQANMITMPLVGALICRDIKTKVEFKVGTGMDMAMRKFWHEHPDHCIGSIVKYKHQPHGAKDKPRIPVFIGFRDPLDMDDSDESLAAMEEYHQKTLNL